MADFILLINEVVTCVVKNKFIAFSNATILEIIVAKNCVGVQCVVAKKVMECWPAN